MSLLQETIVRIVPPDAAAGARAQLLLDGKTKPRRSLGVLEDLAVQLASVRGVERPAPPVKAVLVMAADHGVAAEGVSAYPQEVTAQMVLNFAGGGAAINVLARHAGARVVVVDMGTKVAIPPTANVISRRIAPGTRSFAAGPAMTEAEAIAALEAGIEIAASLADEGVTVLGIGEMGIGNTTSASALVAAYSGAPAAEVTGRGTGIDDETLRRKVAVIERALSVNRPDPADALGVLARLGGLEIAGLAGAVIGAASRRMLVVMDGFISTAAALAAARLAPAATGYLVASHASVEVGHKIALRELDRRPCLQLDMRLGEGTGAALALGLVDAAVKVLHEMATFGDAGVTDTGK